jgi:type I restriction enzyme S subunit
MTTGWPEVPLGDVATIVSGATPKTSREEYWDGDICWATPQNLSDLGTKYISDTPRKLTAAGLKSCSASILPAGSVLLSSRAPIGLVAINRVPMATNQGFKSLVPDDSRLYASYLYWWLVTNRSRLEKMGPRSHLQGNLEGNRM